MSWTTDRSVAIKYSLDKNVGRGLNWMFEAQQDTLNRGCVLQWLSQTRLFSV